MESRWGRGLLAAVYINLIAGGVSFFALGSIFTDVTSGPQQVVWQGFLVIGGCFGAVGALRKMKMVEISSISLLTSALLAYAIILGYSVFHHVQPPGTLPVPGPVDRTVELHRVGLIFFILSSVAMLALRALYVWTNIKINDRINDDSSGGEW